MGGACYYPRMQNPDRPANVERVSINVHADEQLLYFTSTSLLGDDRRLVVVSDCAGAPNLFLQDPASGTQAQLTDNRTGYLKSYVYFDGMPYEGLAKAGVSLHAESGTAYYIQGRTICSVDAAGCRRVLTEYPRGLMTAFTHVSTDGRRLVVPFTDARALEGDKPLAGKPPYDIDARVQAEGLCSYLKVYDTRTGGELLSETVPRAWITHVQFSPIDPGLILYNHEWPGDCGIRRMWLFDGRRHIRLRKEGPGISRHDWTCHEMWQRDGQFVVYHGTYEGGRAYVGRVRPDGSDRVEIPLPAGWSRYGHFTVGEGNLLVTDGYYVASPDDRAENCPWISVLDVDWPGRRIQWRPLCRHDSIWADQDAHPHPIFNNACNAVYFTSDRTGHRAVYRTTL